MSLSQATSQQVQISEQQKLLPSTKRGLRSVVGGGLTGGINICIVFPTEFVKTQLQLDNGKEKKYNGSIDVVRKTIKEKGIRGMYRGITVLLAGTVPTYAVRYSVL